MLKEHNEPSEPLLSVVIQSSVAELEEKRVRLFEKRKELTKEINKEIADVEAQIEERREKPKQTFWDRLCNYVWIFFCILFGVFQFSYEIQAHLCMSNKNVVT